MKTLHYTCSNKLSQLQDEIFAAIPSLAPVPLPDDNPDPTHPDAKQPVMRTEGKDNDVWLSVPDDADESALQAVVDAHTPA